MSDGQVQVFRGDSCERGRRRAEAPQGQKPKSVRPILEESLRGGDFVTVADRREKAAKLKTSRKPTRPAELYTGAIPAVQHWKEWPRSLAQ